MNLRNSLAILLLLAALSINLPLYSQEGMHSGHYNPDSLRLVTLTGTALVDSADMNIMYYLDENGDNQPDYHLNFGPSWYQPDSGNAVRPDNGEIITVTGGQYDSTTFGFPTIVVYEINGEFWRDPYNPFWTNLGGHMHTGSHHQGDCNDYTFGWMHDSLYTISVSGTAMVDTTFIMEKYFLDEDADGFPDYFLNFGPPWYEPASGATRPEDGDQISIVGGLINDSTLSMIIVYEINGLDWRDSTLIGPNFGGGWMFRNMTDTVQIHAPFDTDDRMGVNPGWYRMGGGPMGGMMPDSLFGRMLQLFPQNIPNGDGQNIFAGYEIGLFAGNGQNMMWQDGSCGSHMSFASSVNFRLHYNDIQLQGFNINENTIQVKYWDDQNSTWVTVNNAVVDPLTNTVVFSESEVSNFLILTGDQTTGIEINESSALIDGFTLEQNYPNPFNPSTTIKFALKNNSHVILNVYNVLGQKLITLLDKEMIVGDHRFNFEAGNLPAGIYFYELKVNDQRKIRKMSLIK